ncbi:MAG: hypothetical protein KDD66_04750 [Bdellovibrionales bacterium]|nr:hypothetical protein [Bdellovibrionales bacterium]
MQFDDGEVLPGLNEPWTFMGANLMEWSVGLVVFLIIGQCARSPATAMPLMLTGWILTTTTLASVRRSFPDEEKGTRNACMTALGFPPPGIPAPSALQPIWSAAPMKELKQDCKFAKLGLERMFPSNQRALEDPEF